MDVGEFAFSFGGGDEREWENQRADDMETRLKITAELIELLHSTERLVYFWLAFEAVESGREASNPTQAEIRDSTRVQRPRAADLRPTCDSEHVTPFGSWTAAGRRLAASLQIADNPPGTRTNGSSMSALVCIANGSVPITHRTPGDSDACPPTCYWVLGIGASRKSSTIGTSHSERDISVM